MDLPQTMIQRFLGGIKWNALLSVIVSASNFAAAIVAARLLGVDDFGAFSIIRSTVFMMATVAGLGLGITATKHIAELRNSNRDRLGSVLGLCAMIAGATSLCFAGILILFTQQIATYFLNAPNIIDQLRIASFYILFVTINGYQVGALVGFESFATLAKINWIQSFVSLVLMYVFTLLWGLTGASLSLGLAALFNWYIHHRAIEKELRRHDISIRYRGLWQEKTILAEFTFPAALSGVIGAITVWTCNALLVRQADGLVQMAIFTAAYNFRSRIMFVPDLVTRVASPILCNLVGDKQAASYSRLLWLNVVIAAVASTLVAGIIVFTSSYLLALYGKGFTGGNAVVLAIAVMSVIEVMANTFYQPLLAHGKLWWQVRIIICWSTVLVVIAYMAVPDIGGLGLAYAYIAAHIVSLSMYLYATRQLEQANQRMA